MKNYPKRYWEKTDSDKIKKAYFGLGKKEIECPAPNCGGVVKINKNVKDMKPEYEKKGDFFLDIKCDKCQRCNTLLYKGHLK